MQRSALSLGNPSQRSTSYSVAGYAHDTQSQAMRGLDVYSTRDYSDLLQSPRQADDI